MNGWMDGNLNFYTLSKVKELQNYINIRFTFRLYNNSSKNENRNNSPRKSKRQNDLYKIPTCISLTYYIQYYNQPNKKKLINQSVKHIYSVDQRPSQSTKISVPDVKVPSK